MSLEVAVSELSKEHQLSVKGAFSEFLEKIEEYSKKIDEIEIKDVDDKESITASRQARLFLKNERGGVKKLTDKKRAEIKAEKLQWDQLDKAWLKAFQFMEGEYKSLEAKAKEKEEYVEILEQRRKEEVRAERWELLSPYMDAEIPGLDIMTESTFNIVLNGAKVDFKQREEEKARTEEVRLENERKDKLMNDRDFILRPFHSFFDKTPDLREATHEEFNEFLDVLKAKKKEKEDADEKVRADNAKLKKEAEENARIAAERSRLQDERLAELLPYNPYGADVNMSALWNLSEDEYTSILEEKQKAKSDADKKAKVENDAIAAKLKKEAEENARINAEKAAKSRLEAEEKKRREDEEERLAKLAMSGDKAIMEDWVNGLVLPKIDSSNFSEEAKVLAGDIGDKFEGFKSWVNKKIKEL